MARPDDLLLDLVQGNSGTLSTEVKKQYRPAPVVQHEEPVCDVIENQTPPSRILRSGKRVPIGTATKVPPRTASKAARVAVPTSDDLPIPQVHIGFTVNTHSGSSKLHMLVSGSTALLSTGRSSACTCSRA